MTAGCDSDSFVPPRPSEVVGEPPAVTTPWNASNSPDLSTRRDGKASLPRAKTVELILCRAQTGDRQLMEQVLRRELGKARISLRMTKAEGAEAGSANLLVEGIQAAVSRGVALLVLEPLDTPEVRVALREAETRGVAILLLDQPLPSRQSNRNLPTLSLTGFPERSKELVVAALEDAGHFGLPSDGTALLVQNRSVDSYSKQRQESISNALKDSGRVFHVLEFEGGRSQAHSILVDYLKAHPQVCVILTEEDYGLGAAVDVHRALSNLGLHEFILGGYASYDLRIDPEVARRCAGFVERSLADYAVKISELARAAMEGKPLPERTNIDMLFVRTEPTQNSKRSR
jgi:ABC-type sugar transport system substrate-binding protein